jgi:ferredoxin
MQTSFSPEQLKDPQTARSNEILRACVHCGFCTATCPSYQVLGDGREDGQAHRPLPLVLCLHDHLSLGGALHAPG